MSRRKLRRPLVAVLALLALVAIAVPAIAGAPKAPSRATQQTVGGVKFVPNRSISDTLHFKKDEIDVRKGGKIVIRDKSRQAHTFSIVTKKQVPKKAAQVDACFEKGPCGELAVKHGAVDPNTGEEQDPTTPLVNAGKAGFNQPGDSIIIPPRGKVTIDVTGSKDMYYICAIHPWMLGKIDVAPLSK